MRDMLISHCQFAQREQCTCTDAANYANGLLNIEYRSTKKKKENSSLINIF